MGIPLGQDSNVIISLMIARAPRAKGFTLIELMIVVAIIGILAGVSIPKFAQLLERAREGATKSNIGAIRSAVTIYYGRNENVFPTSIDSTSAFVGTADTNFLEHLPIASATPLGHNNVVNAVAGLPNATGTGWAYKSLTGELWANSTSTDTRESPFTSY